MKTLSMSLGSVALLGLGAYVWMRSRAIKVPVDPTRTRLESGDWQEQINVHTLPLWEQAHPDAAIVDIHFDNPNTPIATITYSEPDSLQGLGGAWDSWMSNQQAHVRSQNAATATAAAAGGGGRGDRVSTNPQQALRDQFNKMQQGARDQVNAQRSRAGDMAAAGIEVRHGQAANDPNRVGNRVKNDKGQWTGPGNSGNSGAMVTVQTTNSGLPMGGNPYNVAPQNIRAVQNPFGGAVVGQGFNLRDLIFGS